MTVMVHLGMVWMLIMLVAPGCGAGSPEFTRSAASQSKPTTGPTQMEASGCGSNAVPPGAKLSERDAIAATFGSDQAPCRRFDTRFSTTRDGDPIWTVGLTEMGCTTTIQIDAVTGELPETGGVGCW